jgi:hypothetical protein
LKPLDTATGIICPWTPSHNMMNRGMPVQKSQPWYEIFPNTILELMTIIAAMLPLGEVAISFQLANSF